MSCDKVVRMGVKEVCSKEILILPGQGVRGFGRKLKEEVLLRTVVAQLEEEDSRKIHGPARGREFLQQERHARVILDPVEADPRQEDATRDRVAVQGLVQVP
jgi:hypothetical protein